MSSYLPPKENLSVFNPTVFQSSITDEEIENKLKKLDRVIKSGTTGVIIDATGELNELTLNDGIQMRGGGNQVDFRIDSNGDVVFPYGFKTEGDTTSSKCTMTAGLEVNRTIDLGIDDKVLNVVKTNTARIQNVLAEFRLGEYGGVSNTAAIINLRSSGQTNDCVLQFGTPYSGTQNGGSRFNSSNPTEGYKGAIVFQGQNSQSRQKFHVCLDDTNSSNQLDLNAYDAGLTKSKMSVDFDGNMVVKKNITLGTGDGDEGMLTIDNDSTSAFINRIALYGTTFGFGINSSTLTYHASQNHKFYHGTTTTAGGTLAMELEQDDLNVIGTVSSNGTPLTSDDRIKNNEQYIENATETLSKLTPQIYDKYKNMELTGDFKKESGLITQEVYYNAPELRHLVHIPKEYDASGNDITPVPDEMDLSNVDIQNDPDYSAHGWGEKITSLDYTGLIPYLIKSNQEMNAIIKEMKNEIELLKKVAVVEPVIEPVIEPVVETP